MIAAKMTRMRKEHVKMVSKRWEKRDCPAVSMLSRHWAYKYTLAEDHLTNTPYLGPAAEDTREVIQDDEEAFISRPAVFLKIIQLLSIVCLRQRY